MEISAYLNFSIMELKFSWGSIKLRFLTVKKTFVALYFFDNW